jgi:lipopolysaccharide transport system ATP-binding protein
MSIAIKAENLSKAYQLGEIGTGTISRDLERYWAKVRGKEDPFLKIGETNDRSTKGSSDMVWSLKDIDFEINQGDAVGIIGRNGAGKSTLLKVLSRVTSPTTGSVKVKGRIASLLEVGTGFHPELTGRENIFLNGAILGMRKKEIARKFDEIVDFAGVERYIDTPVKRYSSGMYVRLAFAVAAHLESEILIVDEVLAVGDAEFQKKCLGKMGDISKGEGRTVLFVSHNMGSVKQLCSKGILLKNGKTELTGNIDQVINQYTSVNTNDTIVHKVKPNIIEIKSIQIIGTEVISIFSDLKLKIEYEVKKTEYDLHFFVLIRNQEGEIIQSIFQKDTMSCFKSYKEEHSVLVHFNNTLYPGIYSLSVGAFTNHNDFADWIDFSKSFEVANIFDNGNPYDNRLGLSTNKSSWSIE